MLKKITAILLATMLIFALSAIPAMAAPFNGGATISGGKNIIEAEHFDGGAGNYQECSSPWDPTFVGRPDELVATEECENDRADAPSPNYNVGWTSDGDWIQFTANFTSAGKAKISAWVASGGDEGIMDIELAGSTVQVTTAGSSGWQDFVLNEAGEIEVAAGTQVIKLTFLNGNANLDALIIDFEAAAAPEPADGEEPAADGETPAAGGDSDTGGGSSSSSSDDDGGNGMILWIVIAAAAVVVIVIIAVIVTKKKK